MVLVSAEPEPQRFRAGSYGPPSEVEEAPYAPSGWRPSGRQFLLPIRQNSYIPPAAYGPPPTTAQPTTTEQEPTTTEAPTTTEVRKALSLASRTFRLHSMEFYKLLSLLLNCGVFSAQEPSSILRRSI